MQEDKELFEYTPRPFKGIPATRLSKSIPDIPDIPVIHDIQPFQAILHVPVPPGFPPILQSECKFYISTGFYRNSTEYQLDNSNYKHYILQRKGDVVISVRIDIFSRIEFKQASVLSSDNTNYKNDIQ